MSSSLQFLLVVGIFWPFGLVVRWSQLLEEVYSTDSCSVFDQETSTNTVIANRKGKSPDLALGGDKVNAKVESEAKDVKDDDDPPALPFPPDVPAPSPEEAINTDSSTSTPAKTHIVVSAFDEPVRDFLKHLSSCCKEDCEVFVYVHKLEDGKRKGYDAHDWSEKKDRLEYVKKMQHKWFGYASFAPEERPEWQKFKNLYVKAIPNENEEAAAYMTYLSDQYPMFAPKVIFIQAHVTTWHLPHATKTCDFVQKAENWISSQGKSYVESSEEPMNCANKNGTISGVYNKKSSGVGVWKLWEELIGGREWGDAVVAGVEEEGLGKNLPTNKITWRCCATFGVKKEVLLSRPREMWQHAKEISWGIDPEWKENGFNFEHIWPALMRHQFPIEC